MPDYVVEKIGETPYLYVEGAAPMDPQAISVEMGRAFGRVTEFMELHGIAPAGPPLSVYYLHDPERLAFRAGVIVASEGLLAADGDIRGDCTPAGRVLTFTHVGPYATLRDDYAEMMDWMAREGLEMAAPTWEVYLDDPDEVPEDQLRTKVHVALK
jgi:effector-binding domain-containing protein